MPIGQRTSVGLTGFMQAKPFQRLGFLLFKAHLALSYTV